MIEDAAAQKSVWEVLFRVAGQNHYRSEARIGRKGAPGLLDREGHVLDLAQHIVRKIARRFVYFVDEHDGASGLLSLQLRGEPSVRITFSLCQLNRTSQRFVLNVFRGAYLLILFELGRVKVCQRVIAVEQVRCGRGCLGAKYQRRGVFFIRQFKLVRHSKRELGFACPGLSSNKQWLAQGERYIDRISKSVVGHVVARVVQILALFEWRQLQISTRDLLAVTRINLKITCSRHSPPAY